MWALIISNLDIKYAIGLDVLSVVGTYIAILGIVVQIEKSKHKIKVRSAVISILFVGVLTAIISYYATQGRLQVQQNEMENKYRLANAYLDSGNYLEAIHTYDELSSNFPDYILAMEKRQYAIEAYVDSTFSKSSEFQQIGNYALAIEVLTILKDDPLLNNEPIMTVSIQNKIDIIQGDYVNECIRLANRYWEENDIVAALKTLQNATTICGENYLIESTVNNIKNEFRSMIIEQAEISFKNSGYQAAISVLSEGLEVLDQDPELLTMIEEYKLKKPIRLSSLDYYMSGGHGTFYFRDTSTDNFGNPHSDIIYILAGFSSSTSNGSQTYRIDKKYTRLTGTVFLCYDDRDTQYSGAIKIYGDNELLFSVTDITAGFEPISFDIDISYVTDLTVYIADPDFYGASGSRCLSDVQLYSA